MWVKTDNELYHYGTKEHSGRYDWGSGDRPYQRLEGAHGGVFRRKRKTTESIREINRKATAKIKGKTDEQYEQQRKDEAYDYFKNKRQEKDKQERPMAAIVNDSAKKSKKIESPYESWAKKVSADPLMGYDPKKAFDGDEEPSKTVPLDNIPKEFREQVKRARQKAADEYRNSHPDEAEARIKSDSRNSNPEPEAPKKEQKKQSFDDQIKKITDFDPNEAKAPAKQEESSRSERDMRSDRYASDMSTKELQLYNTRRKAVEEYQKYQRKDNPTTIDTLQEITKSGKTIYDEFSKQINSNYEKAHKTAKLAKANAELSMLSDEELKKRVTRMNLEKQYRDLSPEVIIEGEDAVRKAMNVIGTTLTVANMVLPTASAISGLKRRR